MSRLDSKQRTAILEAAVAVFAITGLDGATIRMVGRKAGVNSALIYYYFENKNQLFEESIRMVTDDFLRMLGCHKKPFAGGRSRIEFIVNTLFEYYTTNPERMQLMIAVFGLYPDLMAKILQSFAKTQNLAPLAILLEGIQRGELKPFTPLSLWWNMLGMCLFAMQTQTIVTRLPQKELPWAIPSMDERRKQIVEILMTGLTVGKPEERAPQRNPHQRSAAAEYIDAGNSSRPDLQA